MTSAMLRFELTKPVLEGAVLRLLQGVGGGGPITDHLSGSLPGENAPDYSSWMQSQLCLKCPLDSAFCIDILGGCYVL